jgi:sugar-specific transcriptional regulator TrmB
MLDVLVTGGETEESPTVTEPTKPHLVDASVARGWTFLTNHAQVLLAVAQRPDLRVREIAAAAGITERYVYRMLRDLQNAGFVDRRHDGRCNLYRVHPELAMGDPVVEERSLRELMRLIGKSEIGKSIGARASSRRSARPGRASTGSTLLAS